MDIWKDSSYECWGKYAFYSSSNGAIKVAFVFFYVQKSTNFTSILQCYWTFYIKKYILTTTIPPVERGQHSLPHHSQRMDIWKDSSYECWGKYAFYSSTNGASKLAVVFYVQKSTKFTSILQCYWTFYIKKYILTTTIPPVERGLHSLPHHSQRMDIWKDSSYECWGKYAFYSSSNGAIKVAFVFYVQKSTKFTSLLQCYWTFYIKYFTTTKKMTS